MLADVVFLIWTSMAMTYGYRRMARYQAVSLFNQVVSYILSWMLMELCSSVPAKLFPDTYLTKFYIMWACVWVLLWYLLTISSKYWLLPKEPIKSAKIKINKVKIPNRLVLFFQIRWRMFLGGLFGLFSGLVFFACFMGLMIPLVPALSLDSRGRGLTLVHPDSKALQFLNKHHPQLKELNNARDGLRVLRNYQRLRRWRRKVRSKTQAMEIIRSKKVKKLMYNRKLLKRANHRRYGVKDPTLMLGLKGFHHIFADRKLKRQMVALGSMFSFKYRKKKKKSFLGKKGLILKSIKKFTKKRLQKLDPNAQQKK